MEIRTLSVLLILLLLCSLPKVVAGTGIYKHVDKDGRITFTNRPINNAQKVSIASFSKSAEPNKSGLQPGVSHIKDAAQKERDVMRRQILEKELVTEEKLLIDTQNFLSQISNDRESSNYQEKVIQLKNKLFLHRRNITAIKKELSNL